jgi:release factor glutamine methyltransferase
MKNASGSAVMPSRNPRTIAEAIDACRVRLSGLTPTPWLDARLLAQFITGLDASAIIAYGDSAIDRRRRTRLFELAERRARGEPIAYITGRKAFCGLDIAVDRRALVPRPETEELVLVCASDFRDKDAVTIADIGTGSGATACALAHLLPQANIFASDISGDALELAAHNVTTLGFAEQVTLVRSDLLDGFPNDIRFDAIVANLPYVAEDSAADLEVGVRDHEPALALMGGPDGLAVYRRLLDQAPPFLDERGAAYFECSPGNAATLAEAALRAFPAAEVQIGKDAAGLDRIVSMRRRGAIR